MPSFRIKNTVLKEKNGCFAPSVFWKHKTLATYGHRKKHFILTNGCAKHSFSLTMVLPVSPPYTGSSTSIYCTDLLFSSSPPIFMSDLSALILAQLIYYTRHCRSFFSSWSASLGTDLPFIPECVDFLYQISCSFFGTTDLLCLTLPAPFSRSWSASLDTDLPFIPEHRFLCQTRCSFLYKRSFMLSMTQLVQKTIARASRPNMGLQPLPPVFGGTLCAVIRRENKKNCCFL